MRKKKKINRIIGFKGSRVPVKIIYKYKRQDPRVRGFDDSSAKRQGLRIQGVEDSSGILRQELSVERQWQRIQGSNGHFAK